MKKIDHNKQNVKKNIKDTFGAYLLKDAQFDGYYDIPIIDVKIKNIPKHLIPYSQLASTEKSKNSFCHFYEFDYKFDGRNGIWNSMVQDSYYNRGFNLEKIKNLGGIISPDFSCYLDLPRIMQIWNVYRSRTICYRLNQLGYLCIPNIRWTDEESYKYAFDGIAKGCAVSVGTLGCSKTKYDKHLFTNGFEEMISRIEPSLIIIYGTLTKEIEKILRDRKQKYVFFKSRSFLKSGEKKSWG